MKPSQKKQMRMYYGSGTVDRIASGRSTQQRADAAGAGRTLRVQMAELFCVK